jgi:hypothetical protein
MKQPPLANWQRKVVCESNSVALFLTAVCVFDRGSRATSSCEAIPHAISYSEISSALKTRGILRALIVRSRAVIHAKKERKNNKEDKIGEFDGAVVQL